MRWQGRRSPISVSGILSDRCYSDSEDEEDYLMNSLSRKPHDSMYFLPVCWGCGAYLDLRIMRKCEYCGGTINETIQIRQSPEIRGSSKRGA